MSYGVSFVNIQFDLYRVYIFVILHLLHHNRLCYKEVPQLGAQPLTIEPFGTNFKEIWIKWIFFLAKALPAPMPTYWQMNPLEQTSEKLESNCFFFFKKMWLKMSPAHWWPFSSSLIILSKYAREWHVLVSDSLPRTYEISILVYIFTWLVKCKFT